MACYRVPRAMAEPLEPRVLLAAMAPVGGEFLVNTVTADAQDAPSVAADAQGNLFRLYHALGGTGGQLVVASRHAPAAWNVRADLRTAQVGITHRVTQGRVGVSLGSMANDHSNVGRISAIGHDLVGRRGDYSPSGPHG